MYIYATIEAADSSCQKRDLSLHEICNAVEEFTDILAGAEKGVVDKPINLTVFKHNSPDLTLIDLPGITRVAVADQPDNIYDQITNMIRHCILM